MPAETCIKYPPNFIMRDVVCKYVIALGASGVDLRAAKLLAYKVFEEFAMQGTDWRVVSADEAGNLAIEQPIFEIIAQGIGWYPADGEAAVPVLMGIGAGFLAVERRGDLHGLTCPLFTQWNPHLLPGYETMQQKGKRAQAEARRRTQDPDMARQQMQVLQKQAVLNLDELAAGTTPEQIEQGILFIMQIDRAGGMALRASKGYNTWMIAAGVRLLKEHTPKDIERLLEFLVEARQDPTVPKGAEAVLAGIGPLLERSAY